MILYEKNPGPFNGLGRIQWENVLKVNATAKEWRMEELTMHLYIILTLMAFMYNNE